MQPVRDSLGYLGAPTSVIKPPFSANPPHSLRFVYRNG